MESARGTIIAYLRGRNEDKLAFLEALKTVALVERKTEWGTLGIPFSKQDVVLKINDIMLEEGFELTPTFVRAVKTITSLSKFKSALSREMKETILSRVMGMVLPPSTSQASEALQREAEAGARQLLWDFLQEDRSAGNFLGLLNKLLYWTQHVGASSRKMAIGLLTSVLCLCPRMFSFKIHAEPALGETVAHLAISLADPEENIRGKAREAMTYLCQMLFCQKGKNTFEIKKIKSFWTKDQQQPWRDGFVHLNTLGEVFRNHFNREQRQACLQALLENALSRVQRWLREASIFLLYSFLGQTQDLLKEEKEKTFRRNLCHRILKLLKNPWKMEDLLERTDPDWHEAVPVSSIRHHPSSRERLPPLPVPSTTHVHPPANTSNLNPTFPPCPLLPALDPVVFRPKPPATRPGRSLAGAARRRRVKLPVAPDRLPPKPSSPVAKQLPNIGSQSQLE